MSWTLLLTGCVLLAKDKPFEVDVELLETAELGDAAPVEDLGFDVSLYDERSEWYLPAFLEVEGWGALLLADAVLRADGDASFLVSEVTDLSWEQDESLSLAVIPSALDDGRRYLAGPAQADTLPDSCTLTVTTATTEAEHAADLLGCLQDWAAANGGPVDLFVDIAATTDAVDWAFTASYVFATATPAIVDCSGPQIVDDELREEADNISLERLELAGYIAAADEGLQLVSWENTWDGVAPDANAGGLTRTRVEAGRGTFLGTEVEVVDPIPASVTLSGAAPVDTWPNTWTDTSMAALRAPDGFVDACAVVIHDALPNEVWLHFALVGDGVYHAE